MTMQTISDTMPRTTAEVISVQRSNAGDNFVKWMDVAEIAYAFDRAFRKERINYVPEQFIQTCGFDDVRYCHPNNPLCDFSDEPCCDGCATGMGPCHGPGYQSICLLHAA